MSVVASFLLMPMTTLDAARKNTDTIEALISKGRPVAKYQGLGNVIATLLPYLEEEHDIDLMKSSYDDLADALTSSSGASQFFLTAAHKAAYERLNPNAYAVASLRDFYNDFNGCDEPEAVGRAMLDGIEAIRRALDAVNDETVVLLSIG